MWERVKIVFDNKELNFRNIVFTLGSSALAQPYFLDTWLFAMHKEFWVIYCNLHRRNDYHSSFPPHDDHVNGLSFIAALLDLRRCSHVGDASQNSTVDLKLLKIVKLVYICNRYRSISNTDVLIIFRSETREENVSDKKIDFILI